jgi:DNA-binding PadR family transcriptional regulator
MEKPSHSSPLSPEYALLGLLAEQPAHGYELHQRLVEVLGQVWRVSLSQTYNILKRLEAQGFIEAGEPEQHKLPARRPFRLTAAGRRRFETWLDSTSGCSVRLVRVEFTTRLFFARQRGPAQVERLVEAQTTATRACLERLQARLAEIPAGQIFNRLGLELRTRQMASVLDWLDECRRALAGLDSEAGGQ